MKPSRRLCAGKRGVPQVGVCQALALRSRIGGRAPEQSCEISPAYGRQAVEVGNLTAIVLVRRLGAHKALNAQNAKTVFNRGEGITKLLGKLALADRNALVIVRNGYVPQDLFFEKGLTRGVYSSRYNYAF